MAFSLWLLQLQVIAFLQETVLIAGGFDGEMYMFGCKKQHWQLLKVIQGKRLLCMFAWSLNYSRFHHATTMHAS